jgi:hypothetical protein
MSAGYDPRYSPPIPVLSIRIAAPGEAPDSVSLTAIVDTGADGTLMPVALLEQAEAIGVGDAVLHGMLGEVRAVHLFEVDLHVASHVLPGVLVAADDHGHEVVLGRNVLNKLILLLDGPAGLIDVLATRPRTRSS